MTQTRAAFTVGITGHRPNRMKGGVERVITRLDQVLRCLRSGSAGRERVALSALAEGSDRMFASTALGLGYRLDALLPFRSKDYQTTFGSVDPAYDDLLSRASGVEELPGALSAAEAAYEAVGRATVDRSDVLLAVWDGGPSAGRGGTIDIIEYAIGRRVPVVWIDARTAGRPAILRRPAGATGWTLQQLAGRSRPATRAEIAELARGGRT